MKAKSTSEIEARALDALVGYGTDAFWNVFINIWEKPIFNHMKRD
ncbi:hypothetical protein LCGC14_1490110 [marine sediment metagenome]|uniref:Uncharacterized protein n=1 Tax=marine sediment metagenome TaxID=412755 RepID=A0A0F9J7M2_9ZZZZ